MHFNNYFCYRQDLEKRGKEIEAVELEKQAETEQEALMVESNSYHKE